jgi:hypothetical protein
MRPFYDCTIEKSENPLKCSPVSSCECVHKLGHLVDNKRYVGTGYYGVLKGAHNTSKERWVVKQWTIMER